MFGFMIAWHFIGQQNLNKEAYRIAPSAYEAKVERVRQEVQGARGAGRPGRQAASRAPTSTCSGGCGNGGRSSNWRRAQSYRIHLSSLDWQHGFSLQPTNINIQVHPGYEHVITLTPTQSGEFGIICNEFCGIGHHTMTGKIYVTEQKRAEAEQRLGARGGKS